MAQGTNSAKLNLFKCGVCGYIEETELEVLPKEFKCPVCGAPAEKFSKLESSEVDSLEKEKQMNKFLCTVCGYIYETELDELPQDFRCPVCGADASKFEKID
ncbi:MAG: hypothetical protein Q4E22_05850 [Coriobacteriia bacterium]|nr:hypothetical protein [Coriobacteriia bacterium]